MAVAPTEEMYETDAYDRFARGPLRGNRQNGESLAARSHAEDYCRESVMLWRIEPSAIDSGMEAYRGSRTSVEAEDSN